MGSLDPLENVQSTMVTKHTTDWSHDSHVINIKYNIPHCDPYQTRPTLVDVPIVLQSLVVARVACLAHPYRLSSLNGGAAGMVAGDHGLVDGTWTLATALKLAVHLEVTFGLIKE